LFKENILREAGIATLLLLLLLLLVVVVVVGSVAVAFNPHNEVCFNAVVLDRISLHHTMLFGSQGDLFLLHDLTCVQIAFIYLSPCVHRHGNCFHAVELSFSSFCVGEDFEKKFQFEEGGNHSLVCDIRVCQLLLAHLPSINFRSRFDG
jgi:hypothetical protein